MRSIIGRRALQCTFSLTLIAALNGCDWDASTAPAMTYSVGGTVAGLAADAMLTLLDNNSDALSIAANGAFKFATALAANAGYAVTIGTQPTGQICTLAGGTGTIASANVASVVVTCINQSFTVGGTITGLGASTGLVLTNGADTVDVAANSVAFTMPTAVAHGAPYNVTVEAQPANGTCLVTNGSGVIAGANVTNIGVACTVHTESVLYSFSGAPADGAEPWYASLLLASDGNFYGTTSEGGAYNDGTVFKITPAGIETVLWSFGSGSDGNAPYGSLVQANDGNLYGTTNLGGLYGGGTVFKITPAGVESVLWSFGNGNDGYGAFGSLIQASDGNFYGMTYVGGAYQGTVGGVYRGGTVFKITPAGVETLLWSFGNGNDGNMPYGKLLQGSDGNFYGMTYAGGDNGEGSVFMITPTGKESVLWSFGGSGDGEHPISSLIQGSNGNFYGTTEAGGANNWGIVFKITPGGAETVLHSFGAQGDGGQPVGSLITGTDGNFYGTTSLGGLAGWGTIYEITPAGAETVLYSLGAGPNGSMNDGESPFGDLTQGTDGTFYGMTSRGGAHDKGTIFTVK